MAYDRELATRIRTLLAGRPVVEKSMFGGRSFMINDKIVVSASNDGDLLVRCDPDRVDELLNETGADWARMRGKAMSRGWLRIGSTGFENDDRLRFWLDVALQFNEDVAGENGD